MLILGDFRKHRGPPNKVGVYGDQVINGDLAEFKLIAGPVGPQNLSWGYLSSP